MTSRPPYQITERLLGEDVKAYGISRKKDGSSNCTLSEEVSQETARHIPKARVFEPMNVMHVEI